MTVVSKIVLLPESVRRDLEEMLRASGYGDIVQIAQWLRDQGYDVGKSTVGVYAKRLKNDRQLADAADRIGLKPFELAQLRMQAVCTAWSVASKRQPNDRVLAVANDLLAYALHEAGGLPAPTDEQGD